MTDDAEKLARTRDIIRPVTRRKLMRLRRKANRIRREYTAPSLWAALDTFDKVNVLGWLASVESTHVFATRARGRWAHSGTGYVYVLRGSQ